MIFNIFFSFTHSTFFEFSLFVYLLLLCIISIIMLNISRIFSFFFFPDKEKISEYECGFEPFDSATRQPFDVHFYLVGLLFLIFDVELSLLFPWALYAFWGGWFSFWSSLLFILLLIVGLVYEWRLGIVDWPN